MAVEAVRATRPRHAERRLAWWIEPALTIVSYVGFFAYATWSVFSGTYVFADPYVSPFFSTWLGFGTFKLPVIGLLVPFLAVIPLGLRVTCYYYRKEYYRAFFRDPTACARSEGPRGRYTGETRFPLVLWNLHRYALLLTIVVTVFLAVDVVRAFIYHGHFFIGLGSIVMLVNVILLSGYTFSCHSFRHLAGGRLDCYSCVKAGKARHRLADALNRLNPRHGWFAWVSMFSVGLTDIYVRLVMAGFHEPRWIA
ncbi:MAG TPA: succinate dehydrogenase [Candidatus Eisenbacteria bacterium]|nr:succinate dehydrogenase [Candidatus Eisenbacteria bacterium]